MQMEGVAVEGHYATVGIIKTVSVLTSLSLHSLLKGKMRDTNLHNTCGEPDGLYGKFEGIPLLLLLQDIFGVGTSPKCSCKG